MADPRIGQPRRVETAIVSWLGALAAACSTAPQVETQISERPPLVVHRGDLDSRVVVSGALDAADSSELVVPRTQGWQISIRSIAEDGARVSEGDRLMELDNSQITQSLRELDQQIIRAANALVSQRAQDVIAIADKELEVERQRVAVAKAEIDSTIPPTLISRRQWQDNKLALEKARSAHATAVEALETAKRGAALEEKVKRIDYDKARRALELAEEQLDAVNLRAPHDGVLLVSDHPWFGRKLQVGDTVQPGMSAVKVSSSATIKIVAQLSDVDDGRVEVGMRAECVLDAYPETVHPGRVAKISAIAREPDEGSLRRFFEVEIALDKTDAEVMRPGMSARVEVLALRRDEVLLAPRAGLDIEGEKPTARFAGGGEREIEIAECTARHCEVTSGLAEGDELGYREQETSP